MGPPVELTRAVHHRRGRSTELHLALLSARGDLLVVRRPQEAETWPGFAALPCCPLELESLSPSAIGQAGSEPDSQGHEHLHAGVAAVARSLARAVVDGDLRTAPALVCRLRFPPLAPVRTEVVLVEARLAGAPKPRAGQWIMPATLWQQWSSALALLDPAVLEYLRLTVLSDKSRLHVPCGRSRLEPPCWSVRPELWVLPLRTVTIPPASRTNTYLVGRNPVAVIDPGTRFPGHRRRLAKALDALQSRRTPVTILLTHHHDDHVGAVQWLRRRWPATVMALPETASPLSGRIPIDRLLEDGDRIPAGNRELVCVRTPGHAPGHACFFDPEDGSLFAGDMVAGLGTVVIDPRDGSLSDYLESLQRLQSLNPALLLPAHGPPIGAARSRLKAYIAHRHDRNREILAVLEGGPLSAEAVAERVYRGLPFTIRRLGARSVLAHLAYLLEQGVVVRDGRRFALAPGDRAGDPSRG